MYLLGVLQHDQFGVVVEGDAEFLLAGGAAVRQQAAAEVGIDPGARYDLGAERRGARIQNLDLAANFVRADQFLLDQFEYRFVGI